MDITDEYFSHSPDLPFSLPRLTILTSRLTVFKPTAYRSHSQLTVLKVLPIFHSYCSDLPFSTPFLPIFVLSPPTYSSHSPDLQLSLPRLTVLTPRLTYRSYSPDLQLSLPRFTVLTPPIFRSHSPDLPLSLPRLAILIPRLTVFKPSTYRSHSPDLPFSLPRFSVLSFKWTWAIINSERL